jgi:hypothetical protein
VAFLSFVGGSGSSSIPAAALGFAAWAAYTVYHLRHSELLPALRRHFQRA